MDSSARPTVFVSYSHQDEAWKDRLVQHLRVLELEGDLEIWDDRRIAAGDDWQPAIETAIARARAAVLLISASFLTSKFIRDTEVPEFLRRRQRDGLQVIPVIIRPCAWQRVSWLGKIQCRPKDGRALSAGTEHQIDTDFAELAAEIGGLFATHTSGSSKVPHLCPACFAGCGERPCKECGYTDEEHRPRIALPVGTVLQGDLVVGRLLGKPGSFGITYLGWDRRLKRKVAIKEYLPRDLASRSPGDPKVRSHSVEEEEGAFRYGLEKFVEEARTLAHLDHPNIVRVHHFFQENGTAYLLMDYHDGVSLDQHLAGGKRLPEAEAVAFLLPILGALSYVHAKGLVHRDVKPSNIYLKGGQTPVLLDFGAARTALGERTQNLPVLLSPGYAPIEQYSADGKLGPWTDVYAAAATLYRMLTGKGPLDANSRYEEDKLEAPERLVPGLSPLLAEAILAGLAVKRQDRIQRVEVFSWMLRKALEAPSTTAPKPAPSTITTKTPPSTAAHKPAPSTVTPKPTSSPATPKPTPSTAAPKPTLSTTARNPVPSAAAPKPAPSTVVRKASFGESFRYLMLDTLMTLQRLFLRSLQLRTRSEPASAQTPKRKTPGERAGRNWNYLFPLIVGIPATLLVWTVVLGVPRAKPDHAVVRGGEKIVIPVLKNDRAWPHLRLVSVGKASHGTTRLGPGDAVTYTPATDFSGEDRFSYSVINTWGHDKAEVLVTVQGIKAVEVQRNEQDGLEYAWIPSGEFQMGCTKEVDGPCVDNEKPVHRVRLRRGFWMGTTEVTVEAFDRFMSSGGYEEPMGTYMFPPLADLDLSYTGPKHPKVRVEWSEAKAFCSWSGGRLPTEAEWEYAARGGKSQKYPWGNEEEPIAKKGARNGAAFSRSGPEVVGSFRANAFHLFDMAGNVLEWCQDTWHPSYEGAPADGSAQRLPNDAFLHVARGGSWQNPGTRLRVAERFFAPADSYLDYLGFRCARDTPPAGESKLESSK